MGKAIKKVVSPLTDGLLEKAKPKTANKSYFDISKEAAPAQQAYGDVLKQSTAEAGAVGSSKIDALTQMGLAAAGKGPSLAEAQLKSAQDRNLAQQLAAVQAARGGSAALNQRALLQNMASSGRELASQSAISRLQERDNFLNQANLAQQAQRNDITGKLNVDIMPKQMLQNWELGRVGAINQAQQANAAASNQLVGSLIGGAATVMAGKPPGMASGGMVSGGGSSYAPTMQGDANYKDGGKVKGPGTATSDSVAARLSDGEFVVKAKVVAKPGVMAFLDKINSEKTVTKADFSKLAKALAAQSKAAPESEEAE